MVGAGDIPQGIVDALPHARVFPLGKVMIADPPRWQIVRHHAPGTAAAHKVKNGVRDLALGVAWRTSELLGSGNQGLHKCPLFVSQVSWVFFAHPKPIADLCANVHLLLRMTRSFLVITLFRFY